MTFNILYKRNFKNMKKCRAVKTSNPTRPGSTHHGLMI